MPDSPQVDARERFTYDIARIAPEWPDEGERMREWAAVLGHYLPRLRDYFGSRVGDPDVADDVISHVIRRALLKLHEIGDAAATWNWMRRTGRNHLTDLARRQRVQAQRRAAYQDHLSTMGEDAVPADLVERVTDGHIASRDGVANVPVSDGAADDEGDRRLGARIPIDRATFETRLAALSADDRRLLELIEIEGHSHAEAAATLGLPSAAASRKRHSRACYFVREGVRAP